MATAVMRRKSKMNIKNIVIQYMILEISRMIILYAILSIIIVTINYFNYSFTSSYTVST